MGVVKLLEPLNGPGKIEKIETAERFFNDWIEVERIGMRRSAPSCIRCAQQQYQGENRTRPTDPFHLPLFSQKDRD
jgi:hypothetical protein